MLEGWGAVGGVVQLSKSTLGLHLVPDILPHLPGQDFLRIQPHVIVYTVSTCKQACSTPECCLEAFRTAAENHKTTNECESLRRECSGLLQRDKSTHAAHRDNKTLDGDNRSCGREVVWPVQGPAGYYCVLFCVALQGHEGYHGNNQA